MLLLSLSVRIVAVILVGVILTIAYKWIQFTRIGYAEQNAYRNHYIHDKNLVFVHSVSAQIEQKKVFFSLKMVLLV